jgi:hypothetical protein
MAEKNQQVSDLRLEVERLKTKQKVKAGRPAPLSYMSAMFPPPTSQPTQASQPPTTPPGMAAVLATLQQLTGQLAAVLSK